MSNAYFSGVPYPAALCHLRVCRAVASVVGAGGSVFRNGAECQSRTPTGLRLRCGGVVGMITIKIEPVCPPIPSCQWDFCAYVDGDQEDGPYGWGSTPVAALRSLTDCMEDCWPSADKIVE
jgi:hypothetical protein